jgi:hypothetical protein
MTEIIAYDLSAEGTRIALIFIIEVMFCVQAAPEIDSINNLK